MKWYPLPNCPVKVLAHFDISVLHCCRKSRLSRLRCVHFVSLFPEPEGKHGPSYLVYSRGGESLQRCVCTIDVQKESHSNSYVRQFLVA